jgi:hypothetical protein
VVRVGQDRTILGVRVSQVILNALSGVDVMMCYLQSKLNTRKVGVSLRESIKGRGVIDLLRLLKMARSTIW